MLPTISRPDLDRGVSPASMKRASEAPAQVLAATASLRLATVDAYVTCMALHSWLLLLVCGAIPPVMLLWLWNEDRPLSIHSLRSR